ncbi:T9SS type A sorting domain-containing protein [Spirosoma flavum]|uniref:T9SS type A sorting domain-containing protein n=1 Tax=Spirosoma flavum TaxID=2048557 RepID=A0ABW6AQA4_9BACT
MKHILLSLTCFLAMSQTSFAQLFSPSVVAAAGSSARTKTLALEWTLGELVVTTAQTGGRLYTQGFHQPTLRVEELATRVELSGQDAAYRISVAPNPVVSVLNVSISAPDENSLALSLMDMNGHQQLAKTVTGSTAPWPIEMAHLPAGTYLLRISQSTGRPVKTYKIIKQ